MTDLFPAYPSEVDPPRRSLPVLPFERFKAAYPRRAGGHPQKPARDKFQALVKSGIDPEEIIRGAERFASEMAQAGKIGTEFVPMAATWLNQQRWQTMHAAPSALPAEDERFWRDVVAVWKRFGRWSRFAGPDPDSLSCRCPKHLLEERA